MDKSHNNQANLGPMLTSGLKMLNEESINIPIKYANTVVSIKDLFSSLLNGNLILSVNSERKPSISPDISVNSSDSGQLDIDL